MLLGCRAKLSTQRLMDSLAAGKKPRQIAAEAGCTYQTLRNRLARHVRRSGFATVEQAIAHHVAEKIKARMPLALQAVVDQVLRSIGR